MILIGILCIAITIVMIFVEAVTLRDLANFIGSSAISIITLILMISLIGGLDQGITMIVGLFESPFNLILTSVALHFLALILSHFPVYFYVALQGSNKKYNWSMNKSGLIMFESPDEEDDSKVYIDFFRRQLGILTYILWINALLLIYDKVYESIPVTFMIIIIYALTLCMHYYLEQRKKSVLFSEEEITKHLALFRLLFGIQVFLIGVLAIAAHHYSISRAIVIATCITSLFGSWLFIYFRVFREYFDRFTPIWKRADNKAITLLPFSLLKNLQNYLAGMQIMGFGLTAVLLFPIILGIPNVSELNPVSVFFLIIIFYYSAFTIWAKYLFYWTSTARKSIKLTPHIWKYSLGLASLIYIFSLWYGKKADNDLHTLPLVKNEKTLSKQEFIKGLSPSTATDTTHLLIGAYGGGLKANVWTLLVMNELEKKIGPKFLSSTLCASGVSGGSMGLGCHAMITFNESAYDSRAMSDKIKEVGGINALSSDLTGWLIKDLYREPIEFYSFKGNDRAAESMDNYQMTIGDTMADSLSYQSYWNQIYTQRDSSYPALIINTTPSKSAYGVSCSVRGFDNFPISIDLLDHPHDFSLTFAGAVSTSNRFPIFSPAARVSGKGHFVDGGYFENSGLMNAQSFYNQLADHPSFGVKARPDVRFINIMNAKTNYILNHKKIRQTVESCFLEKASGEVAAITGGIAALERMPNFFRNEIEQDARFALDTIHLPFPISISDIEDSYHGQIVHKGQLQPIVDQINSDIKQALKDAGADYEMEWGTIPPPLGRLMSEPAIAYMKAMIECHPDVKRQIEAIVNKF